MTGRGMEPFTPETILVGDIDRATQRRVVATVTRVLPERDDYMPVLQALLAPGRPSRTRRGHGAPPDVYAARRAWLERCRKWLREEMGREPFSTQICGADQRRYEAATGDVWQPSHEGVE